MYFRWKRYVPAAKRRQKGVRLLAKLTHSGDVLSPVRAGRGAIAKTFWGKAWCQNLERYSDYSNRLPRGRTYLRSGCVIDLKIAAGEVSAQVMGSNLYRIQVNIAAVPAPQWQGIARDCAQSIDSLIELLQGQLSSSGMERITRPGIGLFPSPEEITFTCSCPDSAAMCKHVAATLYGIGARLDAQPELLFSLRMVDAKEFIARAGEGNTPVQKATKSSRILDSAKVADVFGIDIADVGATTPRVRPSVITKKRASASKTVKGKSRARKSAARSRGR